MCNLFILILLKSLPLEDNTIDANCIGKAIIPLDNLSEILKSIDACVI